MDDNTIAYNTNSIGIENSRWQEMELVLDSINHNGMSSIGSTGHTSTDIVILLKVLVIISFGVTIKTKMIIQRKKKRKQVNLCESFSGNRIDR